MPRLIDHAHAYHIFEAAHANGTWSGRHPNVANHMLSVRFCVHEEKATWQAIARLFMITSRNTQELRYESCRLIEQP